MRDKISNYFYVVVKYVLVLFTLITIVSIIYNSKLYSRMSHFNVMIVLLVSLILFCAVFYIYRKTERISKGFLVLIFGILFFYQLIFVTTAFTPIGWDVIILYRHATYESGADSYLITYPNNSLITLIFQTIYRVFNGALVNYYNFWIIIDALNILIVDLTIFLTYNFIKMKMNDKVANVSLFLLIISIGIFPYLIVPYSDVFGLFFIPFYLNLLLYIENGRYKKIASVILGLCFILGYMIKPYIFIFAIAYFISFIFKEKKKASYQLIICLIVGCLFCMSIIPYINNTILYNNHSKEYKKDKKFPITHFLMMGLNESEGMENKAFGAYKYSDIKFTSGNKTHSDKVKNNMEIVKYRLYSRSFSENIKFFLNKYIWSSADGTFHYEGEGTFHYHKEKTGKGIRGVFENITYTNTWFYQNVFSNFQQGVWLIILVLSIIGVLRNKDQELKIIILALVGFCIYIMLFEARARYFIIFIPLYIIVAANGINVVMKRMDSLKS